MPTPADLRRDLVRLTGLAERDLRKLMAQATSFEQAEAILADTLPSLITQYGEAAALLGAEWYDDLRDQHEVAGRFSAAPADLPDQGAVTLAQWARSTAANLVAMEGLVAGGMTRRINDWSRATVTNSALADPRAEGWMRVGRGQSCAFCSMLIGRGDVYRESSVRFASHDSCNCGAAPKWAGVADVFDVEEFRASQRRRSDETREADNARARDWIAQNL